MALASVPRAARALESYSGVGLEIFVGPDGAVKVVEAFGAGYAKKAGPAYEAGVRVNDAIVSVDGKTTGRLDGLEGTAKALRGPTGSAVTVEVERKVKGGFASRKPWSSSARKWIRPLDPASCRRAEERRRRARPLVFRGTRARAQTAAYGSYLYQSKRVSLDGARFDAPRHRLFFCCLGFSTR